MNAKEKMVRSSIIQRMKNDEISDRVLIVDEETTVSFRWEDEEDE